MRRIERQAHRGRVGIFVVGTALIGMLALATFAHLISRPIEPNEHMYVAASVLAIENQLYRDFAFVQMPYLPQIYALIYSVFRTEHYLLHARIFTWLTCLATVACVAGIAWHYSHDFCILLSGITIFLCCDSVILVTGECSNYALASLLSLAAYWIFVARTGQVASVIVGVLLGVTACVKLYYCMLVPVFVVAALLRPQALEFRLRNTLLLIAGVAVGVLPAAQMLFAEPELFMFNNLGFHRWKTRVFIEESYPERMTLHARLQHGKSCLQHASQMWILYTGLIATYVLYRRRRRLSDSFDLVFAFSAAVVCLFTALVPVPAWSQYFAMPVPFFLVIAIQLAASNANCGKLLLGTIALAGIIVSGPYYVRAIGQICHRDGWTPIALHQESQALVDAIATDNPLVAATNTLIPLEGGGRIYSQWAPSGFMFEISDRLAEEEVKKYRVTSPRTFRAMLEEQPPDAIVTRNSAGDEPLVSYARENGYQETYYKKLGASLWLPGK